MRAPRSVALPSASVADVGFLLLVFFLATTAIRSDAGLPVSLPRTGHAAPAPAVLRVSVSADGVVLLDGELASDADARDAVAAFADEQGGVVAVQAHRRAPYARYIAALDAVLLGHRDVGRPPRLALRDPAP